MSKPKPQARCPTTARSSSSASATRSATGACACSRLWHACTRLGRSRWRASRRAAGHAGRGDVGATTASCCAFPRRSTTLPLDELTIDAGGDRRPGRLDAADVVALRVEVPRVRGARVAAPAPPARRAHPAVAAAPARRRPAGGGVRSYPSFPMLLETTRECLNDVFDVPALRDVLQRASASRKSPRGVGRDAAAVAVRAVAALRMDRRLHVRGRRPACRASCRRALARPRPSCATCSAPRSCASSSTRGCSPTSSSTCSGCRRPPGPRRRRSARPAAASRRPHVRRARGALRRARSCGLRSTRCSASRRAIAVRIAGSERFAAADDAGRLRDALGVAIPARVARGLHRTGRRTRSTTSSRATPRPTARSVARRRASRFGVPRRIASRAALGTLEADGRVVRGEFRPDGVEREWCDAEVLRQLRRRSLAALRREVEPVDAARSPVPAGVARRRHRARRGADALVEVLGQLQGAPLLASALEPDVLPPRLAGYRPGAPRRAVHLAARSCGSAPARSAPAMGGCASSSATRSRLLLASDGR